MNLSNEHNNKQDIKLSFSGITELQYCPRKFQINKNFKHPVSQWDDTLATSGGQAIHEYIQERSIGNSHEEASFAFFKAFNFRAEDLEQNEQNKFYRGMEACYITAQSAHEQIGITPDEVAQIDINGIKTPAIETAFVLRFVSKSLKHNYLYRGKIDLVKYKEFNNKFMPIDFKTHRDKGGDNDLFTKVHAYQYHQQLTPYGLVIAYLQQLQSKGRADKVITNDILNDIPEFIVEYHDIWIDSINPIVRPYVFRRNKKDVVDWFDRLTLQIMQLEFYADKDCWPRQHSSTGCKSFNRPCKYFKVCDIEEPEGLQNLLLNGSDEIKKPEHFNESSAITVTVEV
jgi:hypothetical protein